LPVCAQVLTVTNAAEPITDNQTGEQSNQPITTLPDVDVVSTTKSVIIYYIICCLATFQPLWLV